MVCALVVGLSAPAAAADDSGLRLSGGLVFIGAFADRSAKPGLGAPFFLRVDATALSRLDTVGSTGDRPRRGHLGLYDAFFLEASGGVFCSRIDCRSVFRALGGYEALLGWRAPLASVYVGPRVSWEGWVTAERGVAAVSWPLVVRVDHAVRETRRRVLVAWASPLGPYRTYGAQWDEPLGESTWATAGISGTRAMMRLSNRASDEGIAMTATVGLRMALP